MIHAGNIQIHDGGMQMHIQYPPDEEKRLMSILTNQCTLTAQFDSKERYYPPRCAESTREIILKKLTNWVQSPAPPSRNDRNPNSTSAHPPTHIPKGLLSSFFWLYGAAGVGKSAVAQSLSEQLKKTGDLGASFFFFSIEASRNNGDKLFPTIIHQLTRVNTAYEREVIHQLRRNQDIFSRSREQQMQVLFTEPLMSLHAKGEDASKFPRLIVIDGLDECKDTESQCDILSIIAQTILAGPLPYPFRFLVTSRPEGHITNTFKFNRYIRQIPVQKYDLSKDSDASKDIRTFFQQELEKLCNNHPLGPTLKQKGWPYDYLVVLIDFSSGHFVYPATVMRYIESSKHRPDDRLEIVLGLTPGEPKDLPFSQLDAQYQWILNDIDDADVMRVKRGFSILYLISEKIGYFSVYHCSSSRIIQNTLALRPGDLDLLFNPLWSLVAQEDFHVYHKTLFYFFLDQKRSLHFGFSKELCHESAALYMHRTGILTTWSYAPNFMYFAYHCYLAQPIQPTQLIDFLESLDILYMANAIQNEKALLAKFIEEGEQAPGAKTIFYILRLLSLVGGFSHGQDLHEIHCKKIEQFYDAGHSPTKVRASAKSIDGELEDQPDPHAALDETLRTKLSSWQPSEDILAAIIAAKGGSTSTDARDTLIKREHAVFTSFAKAQHLSNSDYHQQSTLLSEVNTVVAHSYHIFSVDYENEPSLVILVGTYSRCGPGGIGAVVESPTADEKGAGAGAVYSADWFDTTLLEKKFEEIDKFLADHIIKVEKELAQVIDDQFGEKFKF